MVELYEYTWINKNFQKKTRCPRLYYLSRFMMRLNYKRLGYMRLNYLRLDYLRLNYLRLNYENVKVFLTNTSFSNVQSPALEDAICGEAIIWKYYVIDAHLFLKKSFYQFWLNLQNWTGCLIWWARCILQIILKNHTYIYRCTIYLCKESLSMRYA